MASYSLSVLREWILSLLEIADVRSVVEIGAEGGDFTRELAAFAAARTGTLVTIDPVPSQAVRDVVAAAPGARLVEARSPAALAEVPPADAYVIDGDHNHWTVSGELAAIDAATFRAGRWALVLLHDVGWPCGRRDMYYDPAALPCGALHPHARDAAISPGEAGTVPVGFNTAGTAAFALREGGAANGVLTAVEGFLRGRHDLAFANLPIVHGLAVVWSREAPWSDAVAARVAPWDGDPVLARVEAARLDLLVRVIALEHEARALCHRAEVAEARAAAETGRAAAQTARAARAEAECVEISERLAHVEGSLAWRAAGRLRAWRDRLAPEGGAARRAVDRAVAMAQLALMRSRPRPRPEGGRLTPR